MIAALRVGCDSMVKAVLAALVELGLLAHGVNQPVFGTPPCSYS